MDKISKLALPIGILLASIIMGGSYYASQVNKSKSIEKQQMFEQEAITDRNNAELEAKQEAQQLEINREDSLVQQKANCATRAQEIAAKLLKDFCIENAKPCPQTQQPSQSSDSGRPKWNIPNGCPEKHINDMLYCGDYKEGNYRVDQYESAYENCLRKNGLK